MQVATDEWGRDWANIDLLLDTATEMRTASPTFNQLVEALQSSPQLTLFVRPTRASREHLGRGRFYLSEGRTIGYMEINVRLESSLRVRAIAHELAHAFEIACRCPTPPSMSSGRSVEAFASAVEAVVVQEYLRSSRRPAPGRFPTLTTTHGLHLQ